MTDARITQTGSEVWANDTPRVQVSQAGIEVWRTIDLIGAIVQARFSQLGSEVWYDRPKVNTQFILSQVGLEVWRTVADGNGGGGGGNGGESDDAIREAKFVAKTPKLLVTGR